MATSQRNFRKPAYSRREKEWEKQVLASYLFMLGLPKHKVAQAIGRRNETLTAWMKSPFWPMAKEEAHARWLGDLVDLAKIQVFKRVQDGDADLAFKILERVLPELSPPSKEKQEVEVGVKVVRLPEKAESSEAWKQRAILTAAKTVVDESK